MAAPVAWTSSYSVRFKQAKSFIDIKKYMLQKRQLAADSKSTDVFFLVAGYQFFIWNFKLYLSDLTS
jgi:hypothetical protein